MRLYNLPGLDHDRIPCCARAKKATRRKVVVVDLKFDNVLAYLYRKADAVKVETFMPGTVTYPDIYIKTLNIGVAVLMFIWNCFFWQSI
jgi:hypothetical protein